MPTWKRTEERMDKAIQFIWNYQRYHGGDTPNMVTIGQNIGISDWKTGTPYLIARPFRATINMNDPKNKAAIHRFQRLLEKQEQAEAEERQRILERQNTDRILKQRQEMSAAVTPETQKSSAARSRDASPSTAALWHHHGTGGGQLAQAIEAEGNGENVDTICRFNEARISLRDAEKLIRQAMPQMIKVAATRDLLNELVERGYVVSKR
jgi:hypothetical protein